MLKEIIILIMMMMIAIGVVAVYDARKITKTFFSSQEINKTVKTIKIVGGLVALIAMAILVILF